MYDNIAKHCELRCCKLRCCKLRCCKLRCCKLRCHKLRCRKLLCREIWYVVRGPGRPVYGPALVVFNIVLMTSKGVGVIDTYEYFSRESCIEAG
jgi:hypothetical protein